MSEEAEGPTCSIERALAVVGDRWTLLILREVLLEGSTRFAEFERGLEISPNVLSQRLAGLVDAGVLERRAYLAHGARPRPSYHPTTAAVELKIVLAALQQWGDDHVAPSTGPTRRRAAAGDDRDVRVGFVDEDGRSLRVDEVAFVHTSSASAHEGADRRGLGLPLPS